MLRAHGTENNAMSNQIVVFTQDEDNPSTGDVTIVDDLAAASRLVEEMLEAGTSQDRIRVFKASEFQIQVTYKPVVSLADQPSADVPLAFRRAVEEAGESANGAVEAGRQGEDSREAPAPIAEARAEPAGMLNGVRFSSLFRPA